MTLKNYQNPLCQDKEDPGFQREEMYMFFFFIVKVKSGLFWRPVLDDRQRTPSQHFHLFDVKDYGSDCQP